MSESSLNPYCLLFATVGAGLKQVVRLLKTQFGCAVEDVEEAIKGAPATASALREAAHRPVSKPSMRDVNFYLPRRTVRSLWRDSAIQCLGKLADEGAEMRILTGHMVYFGGQRNEFYRAPDRNVLQAGGGALRPHALALLIDDVYDMFAHLRVEKELFSGERFRTFASMVCEDLEKDPPALNDEENARLVVTWKFNALEQLLAWRSMDMVAAEDLANQLGIPFLVVGVKQLAEMLHLWFSPARAATVYLSHPITEARKHHAKEQVWPPFVAEVNALQQELLRHKIVTIAPTAIDELRLEEGQGFLEYTGALTPRWPPLAEQGALLYAEPSGAVPEHADMLLGEVHDFAGRQFQRLPRPGHEVGACVRLRTMALRSKIMEQVSGRDHLFVARCEGILVYRPLFGGRSGFSRGVIAEVKHWKQLSKAERSRRAAFVHFARDVKQMYSRRQAEASYAPLTPLRDDIVRELWPRVAKAYGTDDPREIEHVIQHEGQLPPGSMLKGRDLDAEARAALYPELKRQAKLVVLRGLLTGYHRRQVEEGLAGIWIVEDECETRERLPEVADFIKGTGSGPPDLAERVNDLLPDELWKIQG